MRPRLYRGFFYVVPSSSILQLHLFFRTIHLFSLLYVKQNNLMAEDTKLAVLIDADNISSEHVKEMMQEIAKYGDPTIKRIYGDWTNPRVKKWKKVLLAHAITPIQQYGYTQGKNATDSAMIIDAMDILYSNKVDGFCLVSSDSDFTRLATRLREAGKKVYGLGEQKTPEPFIVACDKFIYLEILGGQDGDDEEQDNTSSTREKKSRKRQFANITPKVIRLITNTISDLADDDGWAFLGDVGSLLQKKQPNFDSRNYGFQKLTPMMKSIDKIEIDRRHIQGGKRTLIYVRVKGS